MLEDLDERHHENDERPNVHLRWFVHLEFATEWGFRFGILTKLPFHRESGMRRRMRGIGQTYTSTSTPFGDYQTVTDSAGNQTVFDPNGNVVSSIPSLFAPFYGPVQPGGPTYVPASGTSITASTSFLSPSAAPAGDGAPAWLLPVGIAVLALFIGIGMASK
jgi:hypothetical protein